MSQCVGAKFVKRHTDVLRRGRSDENVGATQVNAPRLRFPEVPDLTHHELAKPSAAPFVLRNEIVCVPEAFNPSA